MIGIIYVIESEIKLNSTHKGEQLKLKAIRYCRFRYRFDF